MTTPKEALTYISNARWNENADLDDICTMADRALASLQGEDAVERVARIIDPDLFERYDAMVASSPKANSGSWAEQIYQHQLSAARTKARAILAAGLVPDETTIRADEREKCAKAAESVYADPNFHIFFRQAGTVIAAAIRSNRRQA